MMRSLAEAAIIHARQLGVSIDLSLQSIPAVDGILDRLRSEGVGQQLESLSLCYGSWLGEVVVDSFNACWIGLGEPHPPRLSVGVTVVSPIEAVGRRLMDASEAALTGRLQELKRWSHQAADGNRSWLAQNQQAWDQLANDNRYAVSDQTSRLPPNSQAAREAIDGHLLELPLPGSRLLCLAAGGGTHAPLHALAGFDVTVVDISRPMLEIDRQIAEALGLDLRVLQASMDDLSELESSSFDAVIQPVSKCYLPDVRAVYRQVARVLRHGGIYLSQDKQPVSLQASGMATGRGLELQRPAFSGPVTTSSGHVTISTAENSWPCEPGTIEFLHPLEHLLGGLCQSGFVIEDVQEPPRADAWAPTGTPAHRACFAPPYLKIVARRHDK